MKIDRLTIGELMDYSLNFTGGIKKFPLNEISKYLYRRIDNKEYCSTSELMELKNYIEILNRRLFDKKYSQQLKKILKRAKNLIEISNENILKLEKENQIINIENDIINNSIDSQIYNMAKNIIFEMRKSNPNIEYLLIYLRKIDNYCTINVSFLEYKNLLIILNDIKNKKEKFNNYDINKQKNLYNKIEALIKHIKNKIEELTIKEKIVNNDIIINEHFPFIKIDSIDFFTEKLDLVTENIMTFDDDKTLTLDGACKVCREFNYYVLDVFVADIPTFFKQNKNISEEAYKRGTSFYIKDKKTIRVDMLPSFIARDNLSLKVNKFRIAINFKFIILDDGNIIFDSISRKKIKVTDKFNFKDVEDYLTADDKKHLFNSNLILYHEMITKLLGNKSNGFSNQFNANSAFDFASIPSFLVNNYIGEHSSFAIYREHGKFVKESSLKYTQSVTPLRKYVSNINLAFFLNQKGVVLFNKKDLNYVVMHEDEIIEHLNQTEDLAKFAMNNPEFVKSRMKRGR